MLVELLDPKQLPDLRFFSFGAKRCAFFLSGPNSGESRGCFRPGKALRGNG